MNDVATCGSATFLATLVVANIGQVGRQLGHIAFNQVYVGVVWASPVGNPVCDDA